MSDVPPITPSAPLCDNVSLPIRPEAHMSHIASALADQIAQHRPTQSRHGFPPWLRDRVAAYVTERLSHGAVM